MNKVHFTDNSLINATNPVSVNLIGAGGTGSKVLTALLEINYSLIELNHPGLKVRLWDDDVITHANPGRQRFAASEIGMHKAVALINRANRWAGTNWKAETCRFGRNKLGALPDHCEATLYLSCVDTVAARFEIAEIIQNMKRRTYFNEPKYWLDFGNSRYTGQVILSTIGSIWQPQSKLFEPVDSLPLVTEEFGELLRQSESADNTPSCSLAEALQQQDLFINGTLAQLGGSLLWGMFRNGMTENRGFFHNLQTFQTTALKVA